MATRETHMITHKTLSIPRVARPIVENKLALAETMSIMGPIVAFQAQAHLRATIYLHTGATRAISTTRCGRLPRPVIVLIKRALE